MNAKVRFIAYLAAIALGVFMAVWGVVRGDAATLTAGLGLVTTGTLAGVNTPVRSGDHAG